MCFKQLPPEIIHMILLLVPRDSLASSSLVCKDWRLAALPLLYESIRLISVPKTHPIEASSGLSCSENHPEELVNEVIREVNNDEQTFRFSNSARRLVVVWKMNELQLQTFSSAVLKMKNLEHLTWVVSVLGSVNWHNTLALLCKMLTKLCSVRLSLPVGDLGFSNQVMGALINLKELSIGFDEQVPNLGDRVPNNTIKFIAGARNIESLSLFSGESYLDGLTVPYILKAEDIVSRLPVHRFPCLRKLYIGPLCQQIPLRSFSSPTFGLWKFTQNHKQLREVELCAYRSTTDWSSITWGFSPPEVLPSMRRFEGPARDILNLLKLTLVGKLETLDLTHDEPPKSGALSDLLQGLRRYTQLELPCLKRLKFSIGDCRTPDNNERAINVVSKLACAAPELEELVFCMSQPPTQYNQKCLLGVLTKLPNLPRLGLNKKWFQGLGDMSHPEGFFNHVKALCPGLITIDDAEPRPSSL